MRLKACHQSIIPYKIYGALKSIPFFLWFIVIFPWFFLIIVILKKGPKNSKLKNWFICLSQSRHKGHLHPIWAPHLISISSWRYKKFKNELSILLKLLYLPSWRINHSVWSSSPKVEIPKVAPGTMAPEVTVILAETWLAKVSFDLLWMPEWFSREELVHWGRRMQIEDTGVVVWSPSALLRSTKVWKIVSRWWCFGTCRCWWWYSGLRTVDMLPKFCPVPGDWIGDLVGSKRS